MAVNNVVNTIVSNPPASYDAFSRFRVSNPVGIFDCQFTYDLQPLLFQPLATGTGATVAHDSTNRCALMTFASTPTGGTSYMQSYEFVRYQPGKSSLVFITFNMIASVANVLKFAGYSDGVNGFQFENNGSVNQFTVLSSSGNGNQTVAQSAWNLDKLDGTGDSGITLDITKTQILVIDFQALYVGRVRLGFDIGGDIIYCHEFVHANLISLPYIASANLPIRVGMTCTGTVSTTMRFICSSVSSEGGKDNQPVNSFSVNGTVTAANNVAIHLLSVRPKTTFNSIENRVKFNLLTLNVMSISGAPARWDLVLGQALTGAVYADVNATYSAFQRTTAGTLSGAPAIVIASGYASAAEIATTYSQKIRYPITLDAAGAVRALGTLTLIATGLGGNADTYASLTWDEER